MENKLYEKMICPKCGIVISKKRYSRHKRERCDIQHTRGYGLGGKQRIKRS